MGGLVETQVTRRVARRPIAVRSQPGTSGFAPSSSSRSGRRGPPAAGSAWRRSSTAPAPLRRTHLAQGDRHPLEQVVGFVVAVVNQMRRQRDATRSRRPTPHGCDRRGRSGRDGCGSPSRPGRRPRWSRSPRCPPRGHRTRHRVPARVHAVRATVRLEDVDEDVAQRVVRQWHRMLHSPSLTFSTPGKGSLAAAAPRARWA